VLKSKRPKIPPDESLGAQGGFIVGSIAVHPILRILLPGVSYAGVLEKGEEEEVCFPNFVINAWIEIFTSEWPETEKFLPIQNSINFAAF
jgi:hypothetical protein